MLLLSVALFAVVGGALAFKANLSCELEVCYTIVPDGSDADYC
jgi:hypothetical protein